MELRDSKIVTKKLHEHSPHDLLRIMLQNKHPILEPCENVQKLSANQLWLVVKSTPSQKYRLKEGDIIRIGKQKVKVKEIIID